MTATKRKTPRFSHPSFSPHLWRHERVNRVKQSRRFPTASKPQDAQPASSSHMPPSSPPPSASQLGVGPEVCEALQSEKSDARGLSPEAFSSPEMMEREGRSPCPPSAGCSCQAACQLRGTVSVGDAHLPCHPSFISGAIVIPRGSWLATEPVIHGASMMSSKLQSS